VTGFTLKKEACNKHNITQGQWHTTLIVTA